MEKMGKKTADTLKDVLCGDTLSWPLEPGECVLLGEGDWELGE